MGLRGDHAGLRARAPHKNQRPGAHQRAAAIDRGDIEEYSAAYWDLLLGLRDWRPRPWPSSRSPGRRQAWQQWRDRIRARWPFSWSYGRRPDAWFDFEAPRLLRRLGKTSADMSEEEVVWWTDADADERALIEENWRTEIAAASRKDALELSAHGISPRVIAVGWGVPGWFYDREVAQ